MKKIWSQWLSCSSSRDSWDSLLSFRVLIDKPLFYFLGIGRWRLCFLHFQIYPDANWK